MTTISTTVPLNQKLPVTTNKLVALEPFSTRSIEKTVTKSGLVMSSQKTELTKLQVVLPSEDGRFAPGMIVFVKGDLCASPYALNVYEYGSKQFILLPDSNIQLILDASFPLK